MPSCTSIYVPTSFLKKLRKVVPRGVPYYRYLQQLVEKDTEAKR